MTNILASNDVTDYRGYILTDFGDYVEVIDCRDDSLFGIFDNTLQAEKEIDNVLDLGEDAEVLALEHQYKMNKYAIQRFAELRDIDIDNYGNVLSDYMQHPKYPDRLIRITYENLSSMIKSFNKYNGTTLKVTDTADGFKVVPY